MRGMSRGPSKAKLGPEEGRIPRAIVAKLGPDEGNVPRASVALLEPDDRECPEGQHA